jgi:hypothetical protein
MVTSSPVGAPCGMHQILSTTKVKYLITFRGNGMRKTTFLWLIPSLSTKIFTIKWQSFWLVLEGGIVTRDTALNDDFSAFLQAPKTNKQTNPTLLCVSILLCYYQ